MDIVVKGRNVEVPEHYRAHVAEKLQKAERYDQKLISIDVELSHERNPRQSGRCERVEITCRSRGPVVRAEACAQDFYSALDCAIAKIEARLRRAADRRRIHRGRRTPVSVAAATMTAETVATETVAAGEGVAVLADAAPTARESSAYVSDAYESDVYGSDAGETDVDDSVGREEPWRVVREKVHPGEPMTVEDALFQMELVGHDFYLFMDRDSGRPSVVYRRKGYDYGLLSLAA